MQVVSLNARMKAMKLEMQKFVTYLTFDISLKAKN